MCICETFHIQTDEGVIKSNHLKQEFEFNSVKGDHFRVIQVQKLPFSPIFRTLFRFSVFGLFSFSFSELRFFPYSFSVLVFLLFSELGFFYVFRNCFYLIYFFLVHVLFFRFHFIKQLTNYHFGEKKRSYGTQLWCL